MATLDAILEECDGGGASAPSGATATGTTTANITGYDKPLTDPYKGPATISRSLLPRMLQAFAKSRKKIKGTTPREAIAATVAHQFTKPAKKDA